MKLPLLLASLLLAAGCAAAPSPAPSPPPTVVATTDGTRCRQVTTQGIDEAQTVCGTAEEWAEFDRRVAEINASVTCRRTPTRSEPVCYTAEQWERYDRAVRAQRDAERMGEAARAAAASNANTMPMSMSGPQMQ